MGFHKYEDIPWSETQNIFPFSYFDDYINGRIPDTA